MNIDFSKEQKNSVGVMLSNNKRFVEDQDSNIDFYSGKKVMLLPQDLKSYLIKKMLFDGDLKVVEGDVIYRQKNSTIFISSENNNLLHFKEDDKIFEKDLETSQIILMKEDEKEIGAEFF